MLWTVVSHGYSRITILGHLVAKEIDSDGPKDAFGLVNAHVVLPQVLKEGPHVLPEFLK